MPLPWKKVKPGRITRLVADHLHHSPKRGGSLVVETGFPTSLIDLFVKNRDRLRKSPKRRRSSQHTLSPETQPPPPETSSPAVGVAQEPKKGLGGADGGIDRAEDIVVVASQNRSDAAVSCDDSVGSDGQRKRRSVFSALLKAFIVLVLALSTRKLTAGITISAFALLLLEYVTARGLAFMTPCPDARARLNCLIFRVFGPARQKQADLAVASHEIVEDCEEVDKCEDKFISHDENRRGEIEPELTIRDENRGRSDKDATLKAFLEKPDDEEEEEEEEEAKKVRDLIKKEQSRSAKLKSKIAKKIVPKKFRSKKKKKNAAKIAEREHEPGSDVWSTAVECKDESSRSSSVQSDAQNARGPESNLVIPNPGEITRTANQDAEVEMTEKQGYVMAVLFLIVLVGLVGGRGLAIVLTLVCCLILTLTENFQARGSPTPR